MKKIVYIILTMIMFCILSIVLYELTEMAYINFYVLPFGGKRPNPVLLDTIKACYGVAGIVGGFFLGKKWRRILYVEKRYWKGLKEKF